jgi:hypothetical protein
MKVWREIMHSLSSRRFVLPRISGPLGYQEIAQLGQAQHWPSVRARFFVKDKIVV